MLYVVASIAPEIDTNTIDIQMDSLACGGFAFAEDIVSQYIEFWQDNTDRCKANGSRDLKFLWEFRNCDFVKSKPTQA